MVSLLKKDVGCIICSNCKEEIREEDDLYFNEGDDEPLCKSCWGEKEVEKGKEREKKLRRKVFSFTNKEILHRGHFCIKERGYNLQLKANVLDKNGVLLENKKGINIEVMASKNGSYEGADDSVGNELEVIINFYYRGELYIFAFRFPVLRNENGDLCGFGEEEFTKLEISPAREFKRNEF